MVDPFEVIDVRTTPTVAKLMQQTRIIPFVLVSMAALGISDVTAEQSSKEDAQKTFFMRVLGSADVIWKAVLSENDLKYEAATLVLYTGTTHSSCGTVTPQKGPLFGTNDKKIYLDPSYLRCADYGDCKTEVALFVGYAVGHYVQSILGTRGDALNILLEPDCLAGIWAYH